MCEEFHLTPKQAQRELANDQGGLIMTILSMRSFAGAKRVFDSTKKAIDLPRTRSMEIFTDIMFDATQEDREAYAEEKERIAREAAQEASDAGSAAEASKKTGSDEC